MDLADHLHALKALSDAERRIVEAHLVLCRLNAVDLARLSEALGFDDSVPDLELATTVAKFSEARIARHRTIELGDSEDLAAVQAWIHEYLSSRPTDT